MQQHSLSVTSLLDVTTAGYKYVIMIALDIRLGFPDWNQQSNLDILFSNIRQAMNNPGVCYVYCSQVDAAYRTGDMPNPVFTYSYLSKY